MRLVHSFEVHILISFQGMTMGTLLLVKSSSDDL